MPREFNNNKRNNKFDNNKTKNSSISLAFKIFENISSQEVKKCKQQYCLVFLVGISFRIILLSSNVVRTLTVHTINNR